MNLNLEVKRQKRVAGIWQEREELFGLEKQKNSCCCSTCYLFSVWTIP
jgi:hypothetical protein